MDIKVVEKCFGYKIVHFYLVFNDDFQCCQITSWYKHVYSFWDYYIETTLKHNKVYQGP